MKRVLIAVSMLAVFFVGHLASAASESENELPQSLVEYGQLLESALAQLPSNQPQLCMVNNEFAEGLFGLSVLSTVYCGTGELTSDYIHIWGFMRTAELYLKATHVIKEAFQKAGFNQLDCSSLNSSENGLSINSHSTCTLARR